MTAYKLAIGSPESEGVYPTPSGPPWVRIVMKKHSGRKGVVFPWHYIDYTREGTVRMPIACGGSIDTLHNADKTIEMIFPDPFDDQQVCYQCLYQMRQPYAPIKAKDMTFWTATANGGRYILMRRHDMICYAFSAEHWTEKRLERADPRAILSEAIDEGIAVMTAEEALALDFTGYTYFGERIHG